VLFGRRRSKDGPSSGAGRPGRRQGGGCFRSRPALPFRPVGSWWSCVLCQL